MEWRLRIPSIIRASHRSVDALLFSMHVPALRQVGRIERHPYLECKLRSRQWHLSPDLEKAPGAFIGTGLSLHLESGSYGHIVIFLPHFVRRIEPVIATQTWLPQTLKSKSSN